MSQCFCHGEREFPTTQPFSANNLHINIDGMYMQIFDDDPTGSIVYVPISFRPYCGRQLAVNDSQNTA